MSLVGEYHDATTHHFNRFAGATNPDVEKAMQGHVIVHGRDHRLYQRQPQP